MNPAERSGQAQAFVLALLLRMDPLNVNYGGAQENYAPDADAIVGRLPGCLCERDVCALVHQQLRRSFGAEAVGALEQYLPIAKEIWRFWTAS